MDFDLAVFYGRIFCQAFEKLPEMKYFKPTKINVCLPKYNIFFFFLRKKIFKKQGNFCHNSKLFPQQQLYIGSTTGVTQLPLHRCDI